MEGPQIFCAADALLVVALFTDKDLTLQKEHILDLILGGGVQEPDLPAPLFGYRDSHREGRALPHSAVNPDPPAHLVHDAVRPFVTVEIIREVIEAAAKYGAAIAGLPAVDTVKQVERTADGALIKATIPRAGIVLAQTPQGFRYGVIKKAFDEASADGFLGTDEASLVERSGHNVAVVMGSPQNIKITAPADMELAEFYLKAR